VPPNGRLAAADLTALGFLPTSGGSHGGADDDPAALLLTPGAATVT